jgi:stage II sporulation protein D
MAGRSKRNSMRRTRALVPLLALSATLAAAVPAEGGTSWVVHGRGWGHGVGMGQYGALGYAEHGRGYKEILAHYYRNTRLGETRRRDVRVLITTGLGEVGFRGATRACGQNLRERRRYRFVDGGSDVLLSTDDGRTIENCGREGGAKGGRSVKFVGVGSFRGRVIARQSIGGSLNAINQVGINQYVRGVIPNEVPASWPKAVLRAQAVAARSYALATTVAGDGYDLYDDTRSQVYGGRSSEYRSTNRAAKATRNEVLRGGGGIAVAYFFSTSGGETENVEYGFIGADPVPYLKGVRDPHDDASPFHRWTVTFSDRELESRLNDLFDGNLRRIEIVETGRSPRIVRARVVGSDGSGRIAGDALQYRLGLRSSWARFDKRRTKGPVPAVSGNVVRPGDLGEVPGYGVPGYGVAPPLR